jgi:barstar (barnase inhibitor)
VADCEPFLVAESRIGELRVYAQSLGANLFDVDVREAPDTWRVIEALKDALQFPSWCGSSWDSIHDAFGELSEAWPFPVVLLIDGFSELLERRTHLALEIVVRLSGLSHAFSSKGQQLMIIYVAKG